MPGPRHLVRVLDTRTKRTFKGRLGPPKLLGGSLDAQLPAGPLTDGRELLVVVSPNPVLMPRIFDTLIQPLAAKIGDFKANVKEKAKGDLNGPPITGNEGRDVEGWGMDEDTLETMIQRLGTYAKAIVLSGDVHFSSSLALDFWNGADPTVDSRIVQLTSSGSRNIAPGALRAAIRAARFSQQLLRGLPFERLAWKQKAPIVVPPGGKISPARRSRMRRAPSLLPATGWPAGTTVPADKPPDWRWRLTGLRDDTPARQTVRPDRQPPELPDFNPAAAMDSYNQIAAKHVELALSTTELLRLLVFRTNIGLVRFETAGTEQFVIHELWSTDGPNSTEGGADDPPSHVAHRRADARATAARGGRRCLTLPRRRRASSRRSPRSPRTSRSGSRRRSAIPSSPPSSRTTSASTPPTRRPRRRSTRRRRRAWRRSPPSRTSTKLALLAVIADIKATVDTVMTFVDAVKTDGVDARTLFWMLFKVWSLDVLRVRNPAAYALVQIANLVTEDEETLLQIDQAKLTKLVRGEATAADGEAWVQRFSMLGGVTVVLFVTFWDALGGVIDVIYGWDPDPEDVGEAAVIASRALTVVLDADELGGVRPALTLIGVPAAHGGPGLFVSTTVGFQFADRSRRHDVHDGVRRRRPVRRPDRQRARVRRQLRPVDPGLRRTQARRHHAGRCARLDRRHRRLVAAADRRPGLRRRGRRRSGGVPPRRAQGQARRRPRQGRQLPAPAPRREHRGPVRDRHDRRHRQRHPLRRRHRASRSTCPCRRRCSGCSRSSSSSSS